MADTLVQLEDLDPIVGLLASDLALVQRAGQVAGRATLGELVQAGLSSLADPAAARAGLGLVIGTDVQPFDADLSAFAALGATAGFIKKTGANAYTIDTNTYLTGNQVVTLSGDVSGSGATSINVTLATVPIAKGGTGATDAPTARTNLGLGSIATQAANSVAITGGSVTGLSTLTTSADATINGHRIGTGGGNGANSLTIGTAANPTSTGANNTAIGVQAMQSAANGANFNVAIGTYALGGTGITAARGVAVGVQAVGTGVTTATNFVGVGYQSLVSLTSGSDTIAIGSQCLQSLTTGQRNIAMGSNVGNSIGTGNDNVYLGYRAAMYLADGATQTTASTNGIYIGSGARSGGDSTTNQIVIGYNAIGNGSNTATIGNSSTTANYFYGSVRNASNYLITTTTVGLVQNGSWIGVGGDAGTTVFGCEFGNSLRPRIMSPLPDGATAVALIADTTTNYTTSGAKLLSVRNNGVEKAYFNKDGIANAPGLFGNYTMTKSFIRTLPNVVGDYVEVTKYTNYGVSFFDITVQIGWGAGENGATKKYRFINYSGSLAGTIAPINQGGITTHDCELEIVQATGVSTIRLRRSKGTTAATASIQINQVFSAGGGGSGGSQLLADFSGTGTSAVSPSYLSSTSDFPAYDRLAPIMMGVDPPGQTGNGQSIALYGGRSPDSGNGGTLTLSGGNAATSGNGGNLILLGGAAAGSGLAGRVQLSPNRFETLGNVYWKVNEGYTRTVPTVVGDYVEIFGFDSGGGTALEIDLIYFSGVALQQRIKRYRFAGDRTITTDGILTPEETSRMTSDTDDIDLETVTNAIYWKRIRIRRTKGTNAITAYIFVRGTGPCRAENGTYGRFTSLTGTGTSALSGYSSETRSYVKQVLQPPTPYGDSGDGLSLTVRGSDSLSSGNGGDLILSGGAAAGSGVTGALKINAPGGSTTATGKLSIFDKTQNFRFYRALPNAVGDYVELCSVWNGSVGRVQMEVLLDNGTSYTFRKIYKRYDFYIDAENAGSGIVAPVATAWQDSSNDFELEVLYTTGTSYTFRLRRTAYTKAINATVLLCFTSQDPAVTELSGTGTSAISLSYNRIMQLRSTFLKPPAPCGFSGAGLSLYLEGGAPQGAFSGGNIIVGTIPSGSTNQVNYSDGCFVVGRENTGNIQHWSCTRNLPATQGDYVEVCTLADGNPAWFEVDLLIYQFAGIRGTRRYRFRASYSSSFILTPYNEYGDSNHPAGSAELEYFYTGTPGQFQLRLRRTAATGSTIPCIVHLRQQGSFRTNIVGVSGTGTSSGFTTRLASPDVAPTLWKPTNPVGNDGNGLSLTVSGGDGVGTNRNGGTLVLAGGAATGTGTAGPVNIQGQITIDKTVTAAGTTGAQTINKTSGSVNFAAGATSLVVTNSLVSTSSVVIPVVASNDSTMKSVRVVQAAGSFTLYADAAPTAETRVNFLVLN